MEQLSTGYVTASSVNMFKNKVDTSQDDGLHIDEHSWTLDKPMASLSACHLGLWLGWQILLHLVKTNSFMVDIGGVVHGHRLC